MTWNVPSDDVETIARQVVLWIRTAKEAGYPHGDPDWLPSDADIAKSALFERIRAGKAPLPYPPPCSFSCPHYALVEDPNPHYVGEADKWGPYFYDEGSDFGKDAVNIFQSIYKIVERKSKTEMVIRDGRHDTPYRFRFWFDPKWCEPGTTIEKGGWFMQNIPSLISDETQHGTVDRS
jgi:hypothetical protein